MRKLILLLALAFSASSQELLTLERVIDVRGVAEVMKVADLDADGKKEILIGSTLVSLAGSEGYLSIFTSKGELVREVPLRGGVKSVEVVDLDADGKLEVAVASEGSVVLLDSRGNVLRSSTPRPLGDISCLSLLDSTLLLGVGQLSGQLLFYELPNLKPLGGAGTGGIPTLVISTELNGTKAIFVGATGAWGRVHLVRVRTTYLDPEGRKVLADLYLPGGVTDAEVADLDADEELEIVAACGKEVCVIENAKVERTFASELIESYLIDVEVVDLDADEELEVIAASSRGLVVFSPRGGVELELKGAYNDVEVVDVDFDGEPELLAAMPLRFLVMRGSRSIFSFEPKIPQPLNVIGIADLDADGFSEVLVGGAELFVFSPKSYVAFERGKESLRRARDAYATGLLERAKRHAAEALSYFELLGAKAKDYAREAEMLLELISAQERRLEELLGEAQAHLNASKAAMEAGKLIEAVEEVRVASSKFLSLRDEKAAEECKRIEAEALGKLRVSVSTSLLEAERKLEKGEVESLEPVLNETLRACRFLDDLSCITSIHSMLAGYYLELALREVEKQPERALVYLSSSLGFAKCANLSAKLCEPKRLSVEEVRENLMYLTPQQAEKAAQVLRKALGVERPSGVEGIELYALYSVIACLLVIIATLLVLLRRRAK